jgi:hypothetical protein
VDRKLAWGVVGTAEFLYNRDVNGVYYFNANQTAPNASFAGADNRVRWTTSNKINAQVQDAVVMKNESVGHSWHASVKLQKRFKEGFVMGAYSYGEAKNTVDPGSIAFGSWSANQVPGNPNNPPVGLSPTSPGHRVFLTASYKKDYFKFGSTMLSVFWQGYTIGNGSYAYSGDLNGDGNTSNDLIYIPKDTSEMNFQPFTSGTTTFTAAQQAAAWDAYINQDSYLSKHRGQYAERGAVFLPMVFRGDLSLAQDLFRDMGGKRHGVQLRLDILNVSNLLNHNWGVGQRFVSTQPLIVPTAAQGGAADAQGRAQYRLQVINGALIGTSLQQTLTQADVYSLQFSVRYSFH